MSKMGWEKRPPETRREAVMQALGAASGCWENPGGAGVFDNERAIAIGEELLDCLSDLAADDRRDERPL